MNKNTIHLKDNISLMKDIPDDCIDLIYCDILYGTGRKFKNYTDLKPIKECVYEHYKPRIKDEFHITGLYGHTPSQPQGGFYENECDA